MLPEHATVDGVSFWFLMVNLIYFRQQVFQHFPGVELMSKFLSLNVKGKSPQMCMRRHV